MSLVTEQLFIAGFKKNGQAFRKRLEKYCDNDNEKNIHDIRTSIRRLNSSYNLLSKKMKNKPTIRNYMRLSKILFKHNSEVRDVDIICQHLKQYENKESNKLQAYLRRKREKTLKSAINLALQLKKLRLPEIDAKFLSSKKIQSNFAKEEERLQRSIVKDGPDVFLDPKKIEELHELRKNSKKLRYLLELLPQQESIPRLIKMQDKLGSIHDFDITITFLKCCEQNSTVQRLIRSEAQKRDKEFQESCEIMIPIIESIS